MITKTIDKFDPFLTTVCVQLLKKLEEYQIPKGEKGFNKCWLFQQLLFFISKDLEKKGKKLDLSYGWFRDGLVFAWEDDCPNCGLPVGPSECSNGDFILAAPVEQWAKEVREFVAQFTAYRDDPHYQQAQHLLANWPVKEGR